jgi:hypothetical protein
MSKTNTTKRRWLYQKRQDGKYRILEIDDAQSDTAPTIIPKVHTEELAKLICEDHNARI